MKIYMVGGCVRDKLLGLEPKDIDYVVVGATPTDMEALGFNKVGASFPVFLHPVTRHEYALARTERKVGAGYHGFETIYDPSVTLEEDLLRRDLTINAMAMDPDTGEVIDPYGGRADLEARVLRHTSEAFAEDPVRVLRTARFAARYNFKISEATLDLMDRVVPELEHVPAERIWTEVEKGLMEAHPYKMFEALDMVDAFRVDCMRPYKYVHPDKLAKVTSRHDLVTRFMLIASNFEDKDYIECRVPSNCAAASRAFNRNFAQLTLYPMLDKARKLKLFHDLRAFGEMWLLSKCIEALKFYDDITPVEEFIATDLERLGSVDAAAIAASCATGAEVKEKLYAARMAVLE
jgi:tRNA nucleotidyltransferase/poly(A) polymerase